MESFHKWAQSIMCLAILALVSWFIFKPQSTQIPTALEYWQKRGFKTDTTIIKLDYKIPNPIFKFTVPPAQVYSYNTPVPITGISIKLHDSLIQVIDSLHKHITTINSKYLKQFPNENKILYGAFTGDSLRLDLLHTDGGIRSDRYGVNYSKFKYQYLNGILHADPIKSDKGKNYSTQLYGYGGYDFLGKPILGADYNLFKNNWRLKGNSFITIDKNPSLSLQGTIGYRIK